MKSFLTKTLVLTLLTGSFLKANLHAEDDLQPSDNSQFVQLSDDELGSLPVAPTTLDDEELIIEEPIDTAEEIPLDD